MLVIRILKNIIYMESHENFYLNKKLNKLIDYAYKKISIPLFLFTYIYSNKTKKNLIYCLNDKLYIFICSSFWLYTIFIY